MWFLLFGVLSLGCFFIFSKVKVLFGYDWVSLGVSWGSLDLSYVSSYCVLVLRVMLGLSLVIRGLWSLEVY